MMPWHSQPENDCCCNSYSHSIKWIQCCQTYFINRTSWKFRSIN